MAAQMPSELTYGLCPQWGRRSTLRPLPESLEGQLLWAFCLPFLCPFLHPFKTGVLNVEGTRVPEDFLGESCPPASRVPPVLRTLCQIQDELAPCGGPDWTASYSLALISEGTSHGAGGKRSQLPDSLSKIFLNHAKLGKIATVFCEIWMHPSSTLEGGGKEP